MNEKLLIEAYIRNWENNGDGDDDWAFAEVYNMPFENSKQAWLLILKLLVAAPSKKFMAYVASGPLQDLLDLEGTKLDSALKKEAENNERLRYAMAGVNLDKEESDYYQEFEKLVKSYELDVNDPITKSAWSEEDPRPGQIDQAALQARLQ